MRIPIDKEQRSNRKSRKVSRNINQNDENEEVYYWPYRCNIASVKAVSITSCGEDPIEEIDKEQVDDEKEETGKETSQIVGVWKRQ